jgi:glycosyltransferase involved in cell wall biosynthesis
MDPTVSVVIAAFDYGRFIGHAIRSSLDQTFTDREIIVVDDGSTDETASVVAGFGGAVRYIAQPGPLGISIARNTAIAAARGRYVAFLDADDLWQPTKLARQVPVLAARPDVVMVYCDSTYFDHATGGDLDRHSDRFLHAEGGIVPALLLRGNFIASPTPVVRREALTAVGGFDPTLRFAEDYDMWLRVAARGDVAYVDEPLARYRLHGAQASRKIDLLRDAQLRVLAKAMTDPGISLGGVDVRRAIRNIWVDCGLCHLTSGNYDSARANLLKAIRADPRMLTDARLMTRLVMSFGGATPFRAARLVRQALGRQRVRARPA